MLFNWQFYPHYYTTTTSHSCPHRLKGEICQSIGNSIHGGVTHVLKIVMMPAEAQINCLSSFQLASPIAPPPLAFLGYIAVDFLWVKNLPEYIIMCFVYRFLYVYVFYNFFSPSFLLIFFFFLFLQMEICSQRAGDILERKKKWTFYVFDMRFFRFSLANFPPSFSLLF